MDTLLLIDGNSLMHRAYHALPALRTATGQPTGAVYGFSSMLLKAFRELEPSHILVAFDTPKPTFRHKVFPKYKAQRPKMGEELKSQVELVKEVVDAFGFKRLEVDGYEADDVIATVVAQIQNSKIKIQNCNSKFKKQEGKKRGSSEIKILIVTGDLDLLQLVDEKVKVYTSRKGLSDTVVYDNQAVEDRFGLPPEKLRDYKALVGDSSDNIPGVKGIGKKAAAEIISRYGSLEGAYEQLGKLPDKWKELLSGRKEEALRWKGLVTVKVDVPLNFQLRECGVGEGQSDEVKSLFRRLGFKSLLNRLDSGGRQKQGQLFEAKE